MSSRYAFNEEAVKRSRETIVDALDRIEAERAGGDYLVGDGFTVADLTAAALLYPLVWPREYQYELPDPPRWEFLEPFGTIRRSAGSPRPGDATGHAHRRWTEAA